jgi:hypothetical protein
MNPQPYDQLNKAWKDTCRIVLGGEVGELKDYAEWLQQYLPEIGKRKSHVSDKPVIMYPNYYCDNAHFILSEEVKPKEIDPLTINEIKDLDSIVEAIKGKWEYVGNKVLGNSSFVQDSDNVIDSHYVLDSIHVQKSSNVYNSIFVTENSKNVFGSHWIRKGEFLIKCTGDIVSRSFETCWTGTGSDLYYCHGCMGCHDLFFCFNQRNKRNCIGNLELPKERYLDLKRKLLEELRGELKSSKSLPSLYELVPSERPKENESLVPAKERQGSMNPINKAFSTTSKIIFKTELKNIEDHEEWLSRYMMKTREFTSLFGSKVYRLDHNFEISVYPEDSVVSQEEAAVLATRHLNEEDLTSISKIREKLSEIAYVLGTSLEDVQNTVKSPSAWHSSNLYKVKDSTYDEYCGVCGVILHSRYAFGSHRIVNVNFSINCYNSSSLNRCYGLDTCRTCSDSYFAHNCEGLAEAMFCFNAKGKRYAIGNTELPPEHYRKIKDSLVSQMADEIIETKRLKYDIFNIGCGRI